MKRHACAAITSEGCVVCERTIVGASGSVRPISSARIVRPSWLVPIVCTRPPLIVSSQALRSLPGHQWKLLANNVAFG